MESLKDTKPDDKRTDDHDDKDDDESLIEASATDANYATFVAPETEPAWVAGLHVRMIFYIKSLYLLFKMW